MENKLKLNSKLKSYVNIKQMPKLSKNQKIRNEALLTLETVKLKLNRLSYLSIKNKINDKRIDAVGRIINKLNLLKFSNDKNITQYNLSNVINKIKEDKANVFSKYLKRKLVYLPLIEQFNKNRKPLTIKNITPNKLKAIISKLNPLNKNLLTVGSTRYVLNEKTIKRLLDNIDSIWFSETDIAGSDPELIQNIKEVNSITLSEIKWMGKNHNEGAFFKYYNNTKIDLTDFQIYENKQSKYEENCLVKALIECGLDNTTVKIIRNMINAKYCPTNKLTEICKKCKIYIRVKHLNHATTKNYGDKQDTECLIGLIDQHYFAVKKIPYTLFAIKNYHKLSHIKDFHLIMNNAYKTSDKRETNSWEAIKYMYENKNDYLSLIPFNHIIDTQYHNEATEITDLNYVECDTRPNYRKETSIDLNKTKVIYFDFETDTQGEYHIPYMVCNSETDCKYGEKCGLFMLRSLYEKFNQTHETLLLYAHNLGYDYNFIQQYISRTGFGSSEISRGSTIMEVKGQFYYAKGKSINIILRDSYCMISTKLSTFGKMFNIKQEKELIPYSLYTKNNIKDVNVSLEICKFHCDKQVESNILNREITKKDYDDYFELFINNAKNWNCCYDDCVDIIEYSKIYCELDVKILKEGFNKFASLLQEGCDMNLFNYISSAQMSHDYMLKNKVYDNVKQLNSTPREYIMKCMVGGRTMVSNNKKKHIKKRVSDFDAVSLYPSAMSRLGGLLKGEPKVINDCNLNYEYLQKQDGYFIQIKINNVGKKYKFPLMSNINKSGVREWTNEPTQNLYVDKITLEDLIEYHKIEFDIIDGYYYDEGRDNSLKEQIDYLFNERLKLKKEKNPLEQIFKLIMNSSYGKTLQKPITDKVNFVKNTELDKFIDKHYNRIIDGYEKLYGGNEDYSVYRIKTEKGICEHFNNVHCGIEILSMSKRIMNEVMCLAEDVNIPLYYQDTDSIHIEEEHINKLADKYEDKFNRKLIGKGMGQFHSDFDSDIIKSDIHAIESIFLGKKCYIDVLCGKDENGNVVYDYHIRMKGVSNLSILYKAKSENRSLLDIYKSLFDGNPETFDLCCGGNKVCFERNSNFTIYTKQEFLRTLKFN